METAGWKRPGPKLYLYPFQGDFGTPFLEFVWIPTAKIPFVVRTRFQDPVYADFGIEIRAPGVSKPCFRIECLAQNDFAKKAHLKDSRGLWESFPKLAAALGLMLTGIVILGPWRARTGPHWGFPR